MVGNALESRKENGGGGKAVEMNADYTETVLIKPATKHYYNKENYNGSCL
jgi:hypothetical protein